MKVIKPLVIIVLVAVSSYLMMGVIAPSDYKVVRTIKIAAPIDVVFNQTSIFSNWAAWSAWAANDPAAKYTIEQDNQQIGASMSWEGDISGKGKMVSTEVESNNKFIYQLSFIEPFEMTSHGGFSYTMVGDSVLLTWYDEGDFDFMMRPMMLFMNIEDQIGPMFEQGLLGIKEICEKMDTRDNNTITEVVVESKSILFISEKSSLKVAEIGAKMGAAYGELMALMSIAQLDMASAPISITKKFSLAEMTCEFDAAIPVVALPEDLKLSGRIQKGNSYGGKALKMLHKGSFLTIKSSYDKFFSYIKKNGYETNGNSWEEYVDDPAKVAEEERRTFIYFPIK